MIRYHLEPQYLCVICHQSYRILLASLCTTRFVWHSEKYGL